MAEKLRAVADGETLDTLMLDIGRRARAAARALALAPAERKNAALRAAAAALRASAHKILAANAADVADAEARGTAASFLDRLRLDPKRLEAIAAAVEDVAGLPDPIGRVLATWTRPNGLVFERVATPLGVIGVIFESRPNVTADAGALCLKSGNAAILRAGSESFRTSTEIAAALREGLAAAGLPADAIQLVPTRDRAAVGMMLGGLAGSIDVIVPRGGKSLVARVQEEARVPVFAHLEGICHVYVHAAADLEMALAIVRNAKLRRTGICGAAETLLVDRACAGTHLAPLVTMLLDAGCAVRATRRRRPSIRASRRRPTRTGVRNISTRSSRCASSTASTRPSITSRHTAPTTPTASSLTMPARHSRSLTASTAPSYCTTPRRSSLTAASSASAPRSASQPGACMPGARSAWSS